MEEFAYSGSYKETFGFVLYYLMENKKISVEKLSKELNVKKVTIEKWIKNEKRPTIEQLLKLKKILNTSLNFLTGRRRIEPPHQIARDVEESLYMFDDDIEFLINDFFSRTIIGEPIINIIKLEMLMDYKKFNACDFAKEINVSTQDIILWLSGEKNPNRDDVVKICRYFQILPSFLLDL